MKLCPNCGKQYPDDANFCPTDAGRLELDAGETQRGHAASGTAETLAAEPDQAIGGRFDLVAQIGGGHTGQVIQARDRQTGQPCAIKLVHPAVFPNPLLLQRAERELKQLERVELPEVARVLGHGRRGDQLWIAMELVSGVELVRVVVEGGPMPALRACYLIRQVAHGLAEAAKQGVIHRDLAAKNVIVGDGDTVKIINFPIAVPFSDRVQGVAEFLSPEQVEGKPADQRSSIYSLGALLYFAMTGRPPFLGEPGEVHRAHLTQEPIRPSHIAPVPEAIEALIMKALEKTSAKRFMTLHQMIGELDSVLAGAAAAATAVAAQGKNKAPAAQVGPAQTLVGVSAFQVQPGAQAVGQGTMAGPAPAAMPLGGGGATLLDPMIPTMMAGEIGGGGGGGMAGGRGQGRGVDGGGTRPPAVIVPTPPATPALHLSPGKGKGKGGSVQQQADTKGKFRETMWFKKGELDEAAAAAAATAQEGDLVHDKADGLPIEDRYRDDGTLDRRDAERLSLRTGGTAMMQAQRAQPMSRKQVSERELVGELKRGRIWMVLFVLAVMGAVGGTVYYFMH